MICSSEVPAVDHWSKSSFRPANCHCCDGLLLQWQVVSSSNSAEKNAFFSDLPDVDLSVQASARGRLVRRANLEKCPCKCGPSKRAMEDHSYATPEPLDLLKTNSVALLR
jgi:hypothetical protein